MNRKCKLMKVRTTGILIEDEKILLLNQDVDEKRSWSLPGGTLEEWETLEACLIREMREETGLDVKVGKLLYICDLIKDGTHVIHITFLVEKVGGILWAVIKGLDTRKIREVAMIPISDLDVYGFSLEFKKIVQEDFPQSGSYMWAKSNIGL